MPRQLIELYANGDTEIAFLIAKPGTHVATSLVDAHASIVWDGNMKPIIRPLALLVVLVSSSCSGSGGSDPTPPAAPTGLSVALMTGSPHLTWSDNASNEDGFSIERKPDGGTFAQVTTETFDVEQFHDSACPSGDFVYRVMAQNAAGISAPSNEVPITVP